MSMRPVAPSVGRLSANCESKMRAVAPSAASVMAMPTTIWSRPSRTHSTTMITLTAAPAAAPPMKPRNVLVWYAVTNPTYAPMSM